MASWWPSSRLARNSPSVGMVGGLSMLVGIFVVMVMMLRLIYRVRYELAAREGALWDDPRPH